MKATELVVRCHIYGKEDVQFLYHTRLSPGPIVQCRNCGLVYVNPIEEPELLVTGEPDEIGELIDSAASPIYQQLYLAEAPVKRMLYTEILDRIETVNG